MGQPGAKPKIQNAPMQNLAANHQPLDAVAAALVGFRMGIESKLGRGMAYTPIRVELRVGDHMEFGHRPASDHRIPRTAALPTLRIDPRTESKLRFSSVFEWALTSETANADLHRDCECLGLRTLQAIEQAERDSPAEISKKIGLLP